MRKLFYLLIATLVLVPVAMVQRKRPEKTKRKKYSLTA